MMNTKQCSTCGETKRLDAFSKNKDKKDGYNYECRECRKLYIRKHYQENKQYYKDKANKRCQELRQWLQDVKVDLQCAMCDENHPACLEYHHKDSSQKDFAISEGVAKGFTKERIIEEIAKCLVLCSNCHKKTHWETKTGSFH